MLNCANTLANCLFFINTFRNRYFFVGYTTTVSLPAAENMAASLVYGGVVHSVSLTAIGAVLDYYLPPTKCDQENSVDELYASVRCGNKWHRSRKYCYYTCINGQFWSYISGRTMKPVS